MKISKRHWTPLRWLPPTADWCPQTGAIRVPKLLGRGFKYYYPTEVQPIRVQVEAAEPKGEDTNDSDTE